MLRAFSITQVEIQSIEVDTSAADVHDELKMLKHSRLSNIQ